MVEVNGRHAYVPNLTSATLQVFDIGGSYIQQLESGGLELAQAQVRNNLTINNDLSVQGGMNIGLGGMYSAGPVTLSGLTLVSLDSMFSVRNSVGTSLLTIANDGFFMLGKSLTSGYAIEFARGADRTIGVESGTAAGQNLTLAAGNNGGGTNLAGGDAHLNSGDSTGNTASKIIIQTPQTGASGSGVNSFAPMFEFARGHLATINYSGGGNSPTVSCSGTAATLDTGSNDIAGKATLPTGAGSSCTLTFARTYTNAPGCTIMYEGAALAVTVQLNSGTGILISSGITVTGSLSSFTTELAVGDTILAGGQSRVVASIANSTSLTTTSAFSPTLGGVPFTIQHGRSLKIQFSPTPSVGDKFSWLCIGQGSQ